MCRRDGSGKGLGFRIVYLGRQALMSLRRCATHTWSGVPMVRRKSKKRRSITRRSRARKARSVGSRRPVTPAHVSALTSSDGDLPTHHPSFEPPADRHVPIWRYMSLSNFIWILQNNALYFCRADSLGDPYEGYYTQATAMGEDIWVKIMKEEADISENTLRESFRHILATTRRVISWSYVSCRHMNEEESSAMWKIYTPHGDSIAIRSTYKLLADGLPSNIHVGCVKYIDYRTDLIPIGNLLNYIVHKRKSFEYERELRAVFWRTPDQASPFEVAADDKGLVVPLEIAELITEVFISPDAKPPLLAVVEGILKKYKLKAPVLQSGVNAPPSY
jgi:hypothetical protein